MLSKVIVYELLIYLQVANLIQIILFSELSWERFKNVIEASLIVFS